MRFLLILVICPRHIRVFFELNNAVRVNAFKLSLNLLKFFFLQVGQEHVVGEAILGHVKDDVPKQLRVIVSDQLHLYVRNAVVGGVRHLVHFPEDLLSRQEVHFTQFVPRLSVRPVCPRKTSKSDF